MQRISDRRVFTTFATSGEVTSASFEFAVLTTETSELVDVTEHVRAAVTECDIDEGMVLVAVPHTTCAVIVNESEPGFAQDLARALERIAPAADPYQHNDAPHDGDDEEPNGYAHVRAAFLSSPSVTLPINDGALALGRWQRIFLVELDRGRPRTVRVQLLGRSA